MVNLLSRITNKNQLVDLPDRTKEASFALLCTNPNDRQVLNRINRYVNWMEETNHYLMDANLSGYRDYLLEELKPSSVKVYLAEVRKGYKQLCDNRDFFYQVFKDTGRLASDKKAVVDEAIERIKIQIKPENHRVKVTTHQDIVDLENFRLTPKQVHELLSLPNRRTTKGIRDVAMLACMLATGIREHELVGTQIRDINQTYGGQKAFHVREGKGRKARVIPYGGMWSLMEEFVLPWIDYSDSDEDTSYVFVRLHKGNRASTKALTTYSIQWLLRDYPVSDNDELRIVKPHDLRRTYARSCYNVGMDLYQIQLNLGHASQATTKRYIGVLDAHQRQPPANVYGVINDNINDGTEKRG